MILTRRAIVGVDDAVAALVSLGTDALVRSIHVSAGRPVSARRRHHALVDVLVAETSGVTDRACTCKIEEIRGRRAFCTVKTLVGRARIQFVLAVSSSMWKLADALVIVYEIDARAAVLARIVRAIVDVRFAIRAGVTG